MAFTLYLIFIAGSFKVAMIVVAAVAGAVLVSGGLGFLCNMDGYQSSEDNRKTCMNIMRKSLYPLVPCFILSILIPSSEQAAALYLIPKITENEQVQSISKDGLEILSLMTQSYVKDMRESVNKKQSNKGGQSEAETMQTLARDLAELSKTINDMRAETENNK